MLFDYVNVLVFMTVGVLFLVGSLLAARLASRLLHSRTLNPDKLTNYECGERPIGGTAIQFNIRFYVIALIFVIFEVEVVFLYPWAVVFKDLGFFAFVEMSVFIFILLLGLAYVWCKGDLEWVKPSEISLARERSSQEHGETLHR
ncbi:MAG TPA: NADH-quinone oxidoreductase subunit A [Candidatus Limnocylindrales bacterium]|jgi:NADH-quinone oxidoreductase subunit A|nr:NADH-quinone oxidoreductase subunit A [Candidatus Limnocylindrales bacterium]